jgi:zinc protease
MKTTIVVLCALSLVLTSTMLGGNSTVSDTNVVLLPVKNDPTISFRIWFKVGSQNDPVGKEGIANITAQMLTDASTQTNSYEQVLDKLYPLAASYNALTTVEMTVIYGRTHKDNLEAYYPLFTDAILKPAFKQDDLYRIKSEVLNYLENTLRYASDEELGKAVLYNEIFAGTPYGHITQGLIKSVKGITIDDVKDFYAKNYTRDNVVIGIGGGYSLALVKRLQKDLATLPAGAPPEVPKPQPKPINGKKVTIVEKDAHATAISMGFPIDVVRGSKDWYALAIANSWLGEHRNSSSHLYQVIREQRGLNYGDYSYIENFPRGGMLQLPPQNVCRRQQIFNGMTKQQFNLTRNFLKKYVLNYAATTMERLGYALDDEFYGIKGSHLKKFRDMMSTLTLADVNKAIKKHLQTKNMEIAIVTNDVQALKDALVSDAASPITYATPKPETVLAEDKQIVNYPLHITVDNVKIIPVNELFNSSTVVGVEEKHH